LRHLWLFAHIFGFVLWMGGGFAAMNVGIAMRRGARGDVPALMALSGRLHRALILPGVVLTVISGLILTLRLYGAATSVNGFPAPLMVMQGAGLIAAALVLMVDCPTVSRHTRLDPDGEHAPLFHQLARRAALSGSLTAVLALVALVGGVLLR
jgi:uncharacterized membrane protein